MNISENEAISLCQQGQLEYFGALYDLYIRKIYNFTYFRTHHKETAEDLTAAIFSKALENFSQYQPQKGSFSSWLYRIAKNAIIDHYRTSKSHASLEDAWDVPAAANVERDADTALKLEKARQLLAKLAPQQRDIVTMRVWDGLSYREIAEILGLSEANAKMIFSRTLVKLNKETAFAAVSLLLAWIS